jgi:hypothetical protein
MNKPREDERNGGPLQRPPQREIGERLAIASKLRDVQEKLGPIREANRAKRKAGRVTIRIKTA